MIKTIPCLLLLPLAALAAQQDPVPQEPIPDAATLQRQYDEAQRAWSEANRAAYQQKDKAEQQRLAQHRPEAEFVPKFRAGAEAHAGTEAAVPYLAFLVSRGDTATSKQAMATLMDQHVQSPGIRLAVARIGGLKQAWGAEQSRAWLDRVLAQNGDPMVQAQALYTRAAMYVGTRATDTSDALRRYAIEDLQQAQALLEQGEGRDGRSLAQLATTLLDEAQRLEPGLEAPEIEGEDLDGVAFKLSDYRGKVVMLDFWGDW